MKGLQVRHLFGCPIIHILDVLLFSSAKGQMLDDIFSEQDAITESDQGRSFKAFWSWLMSPSSQDELQATLEKVLALPEVQSLQHDELLDRIRFRLLEAGDKVNSTCGQLVEQLRHYLADQAWLENRRIMEIVREIEQSHCNCKPCRLFA